MRTEDGRYQGLGGRGKLLNQCRQHAHNRKLLHLAARPIHGVALRPTGAKAQDSRGRLYGRYNDGSLRRIEQMRRKQS